MSDAISPMKYSDHVVDWLIAEGYTHCFFVAGGNIMHLLDSVRNRMQWVPFVNEIGATFATEYFNAVSSTEKAFLLVTAGPGITNAVTGIANAWMESRELLVIGGQVKSSDLARGKVRQRGIQEIDGVSIVESVTKAAALVDSPISRDEFVRLVRLGSAPRKGPIFIEMCLDAQAMPYAAAATEPQDEEVSPLIKDVASTHTFDSAVSAFQESQRPVVLLGGGVSFQCARQAMPRLSELGIPVMLTWNGADRIPADHPSYFGRPNTWGQRYSNVLLQQSDFIFALGTRLGMQQTGFAHERFAPVAKLAQVDIDPAELGKGHPNVDFPICADADAMLIELLEALETSTVWQAWHEYCSEAKELLPLDDPNNQTAEGYVNPYRMLQELCSEVPEDTIFVPSSSGGAFTVAMQSLNLRGTQRMVTDKGMASMGCGLSGAIGAAIARRHAAVIHVEGDGSVAQNMQEWGTIAAQHLPVKSLIFNNNGYASIRMTQRNYFGGNWIGCDEGTGLGLPNWERLAQSFGIPYARMDSGEYFSDEILTLLASEEPAIIEVPIDPEQTYFPKITSHVTPSGTMASNPLHLMDPPLTPDLAARVLKYLPDALGELHE